MQSTISTRRRTPLFPSSPPPQSPHTTDERTFRRNIFDFAAIFGTLFLLSLIAATLFWQFWHVNRIYGGVTIANVAVGGMTRADALAALQSTEGTTSVPALSIVYGERQWPVTEQHLQSTPDLLAAVNQAYLVGRGERWMARLGEQFIALLGGVALEIPQQYDPASLGAFLGTIADDVGVPGRTARQVGEVILPAEPGILVDIGETSERLWAALHEQSPDELAKIPLVVNEFTPTDAVVETLATSSGNNRSGNNIQTTVSNNVMRLTNGQFGLVYALDPVLLQKMVSPTEPLLLDTGLLRAHLKTLSEQIDVAPRDARLRFNPDTGGVTVLQESYLGRALDIGATVEAIRTALAAEQSEALLVVNEVAPAVDMNRVAEMGIRELIATGSSDFQGSSAARVHNIEVAAEKFDGLVIPPGEIFSFNDGVEDVTSANGFEDSLIIFGNETAVGVGGGVCQVSTTIFRAAYSGGFPIVERYNHGYVVSWYGEPGLDATIYTPTVDFRFRNDTDAYLLIEPVVNRYTGVLDFNLYGTKPDREVIIGDPIQTNVIAPEPPSVVVNESLAPGERKQVEWEQQGMTIAVERTIIENGTTRTDQITSVYQPWQAVYEVGPGSELPAVTAPEEPQEASSGSVLERNIALTPTPETSRSGP